MAGCQLENYREDEECPGRVTIDEDGTEEWAVERILSKRKEDGDWKYEIKWHGWPNKYNTWEPASHLTHCQEKLDEFEWEWKKQRKASARKPTQKSGESGRIKTEQGGPEEAPIAGTSGQVNVSADEDMETSCGEDDEKMHGNSEESSELDEVWLGSYAKQFRREWKPTEEPLCIVGSCVVNDALIHNVRIRCPTDPDNVMDNPEEGVSEENLVVVLSKMFREKFPQILIAYYESRLMMLDQLKSDENLVKDAARAGLVHNLLAAKVDANYGTIFKDMMPPGQVELSDDHSDEPVSINQPKVVDEEKKQMGVKDGKDSFGLPYNYTGEDEGTFGTDDEGSSDDNEDWEQVKGKG